MDQAKRFIKPKFIAFSQKIYDCAALKYNKTINSKISEERKHADNKT